MTNVEIKIKNLENEIARLKSESALQNRLEHIQNMAVKRDMSREEEINNLIHEYANLKMSIDELLDRMVNIIIVNDCLWENGFFKAKGNPISIDDYRERNGYVMFTYSESYSNMYDGYVKARVYKNEEFEDYDLDIDTSFYDILNGETFKVRTHEWKIKHMKNMLTAMRHFIEYFDSFEENFYQYAESPRPIN